jgi:hypothetical protein
VDNKKEAAGKVLDKSVLGKGQRPIWKKIESSSKFQLSWALSFWNIFCALRKRSSLCRSGCARTWSYAVEASYPCMKILTHVKTSLKNVRTFAPVYETLCSCKKLRTHVGNFLRTLKFPTHEWNFAPKLQNFMPMYGTLCPITKFIPMYETSAPITKCHTRVWNFVPITKFIIMFETLYLSQNS